ncbi:hypothetical protein EDC96DRAFT_548369 [Choanephora cucurbitarum]|nr:hypothetical protein EDC96DRAFT_548369 [Choanephora cucurbitarum]
MFSCDFCGNLCISEEEVLDHIALDNCAFEHAQEDLRQMHEQEDQVRINNAVAQVMADVEMTEVVSADQLDDAEEQTSTGSENNNPIVYNWIPAPPMSPFEEVAIQFMCLLNEAKTPRRY